jgi:hypothetical protein
MMLASVMPMKLWAALDVSHFNTENVTDMSYIGKK